MKRKIWIPVFLTLLLLLTLSCVRTVYRTAPPPPPLPPTPIGLDISIFYDQLTPYGDWLNLDAYGWVWIPRVVPAGWRPYTHGRWVYTDYGLTWISKWNWGWAPFHYGRWVYEPFYGWVWIPDNKWGPGWVAWRHGRGWIGWAPLPPQVVWHAGIGLDFGNIDINVIIDPLWWCFITEQQLFYSGINGYLLPVARNVTIVKNTVHVTNYVTVENRIVNKSLSNKYIRKAVGRTVTPKKIVNINSVNHHGKIGRGQDIQMYRPTFKAPPPGKTPKELPPPPKPPLVERHEQEKREMQKLHEKEKAELERLHRQQERKIIESAKPPKEIRQQQKEERQALQEKIKRDKEMLKKMHERENKRQEKEKEKQKTEKKKAKPKKPEKPEKEVKKPKSPR